MAYEEKKSYEDEENAYSIYKLLKILSRKWWVIVALMLVFAATGFGIAKVTYEDSYISRIILNISNKDKNIVGEPATYVTASDTQASAVIANNFKILIQQGDDFILAVQDAVKAKTGVGVGCCADYQLDVIGVDAGVFDKALYCDGSHVGRTGIVHVEDTAFLDAYACGYPLVVGVDHLREHVVVEDVVGEI